jgi:dihydroorotate dehydrogenase (NAD+) catalytic subunit
MADALARDLGSGGAVSRPTYRVDRSFEWNHANGPDFAGPWPAIPETPLKDFFGFKVHSRFGVPASILLNSRWIETYARLGFDLLTYKTVRSVARLCHAPPNWLFLDERSVAATLANPDAPAVLAARQPETPQAATAGGSFGIPSVAPDVWKPDIAAAKAALRAGQVLIVSVVGTARPDLSEQGFVADFAALAKSVAENGADVVEADLSCPNVARREGEVYLDTKLSTAIARATKAVAGDRPVLLKIGDIADRAQMAAFLDSVAGAADGVVMINAPSRRIVDGAGGAAFGVGRERAGVTGGAIKSIALSAVREAARHVARRGLPLKIIGVGGITSAADARAFLEAGAYAVQSATAATWNPHLAAEIKAQAPEI